MSFSHILCPPLSASVRCGGLIYFQKNDRIHLRVVFDSCKRLGMIPTRKSTMKLKYPVKQRPDGKWYVYKSAAKGIYWTTGHDTERHATEQSLLTEGHELVEKLDAIQRRMETLPGFIDQSDPYGWRA